MVWPGRPLGLGGEFIFMILRNLGCSRLSTTSFIFSHNRSDVNETCPLCRDKIHGKKDLWEMPERPSDKEIGQFVLGMAEGAGAPT